jgi:hypothetical protein
MISEKHGWNNNRWKNFERKVRKTLPNSTEKHEGNNLESEP